MPTTATARASSETRSSVSSTNTTYVPTEPREEHPAGRSPAEPVGCQRARPLNHPGRAYARGQKGNEPIGPTIGTIWIFSAPYITLAV